MTKQTSISCSYCNKTSLSDTDFICLKKREKTNIIYEQQRNDKGICRQCCKHPIDYSRSMLHCSSCPDVRNHQVYG